MGAEGLEGGGAKAPPAHPANYRGTIMKILRDKYIDQYGNICLEWSTGYVGWVQLIRLC